MSKQRYSPECKDEGVRQVVDRGNSVPEVAERNVNSVVFGLAGANVSFIQTTRLVRLLLMGYNLVSRHLSKDPPPPAGTGLYLAFPAMQKTPVQLPR